MKSRSKGRKGEEEALEEWTSLINRFTSARTGKQKQAVINSALKINPGGALRDMLLAWGYSPSARGRKPKGSKTNGQPGRERLKEALGSLFGQKSIASLSHKLAGSAEITVQDAFRVISALILTWPDPLDVMKNVDQKGRIKKAIAVGEEFLREQLSELSDGRSTKWTKSDMEIRVFRLVDEERVGVSQFLQEAGEVEGSLIVAGTRNILLGTKPVDVIRQFHDATMQFVGQNRKGILIFVFDAAIFEAGREGFNILYNIGVLSTAMTAFAFFEDKHDQTQTVQEHKVDWTRWRDLSQRCCVVTRKPTLVDPLTGELLKHERLDELLNRLHPDLGLEPLNPLKGFVRFDAGHVMPRTYPEELGNLEGIRDRSLYWDVLVRPSEGRSGRLEVQYFIPRTDHISATSNSHQQFDGTVHSYLPVKTAARGPGRRSAGAISVEEDLFYVVRKNSPGPHYDDAQRAIHVAARGRLKLDSGDRHAQNLNAAAALREVGFEVIPIANMLSIFPQLLHRATTADK